MNNPRFNTAVDEIKNISLSADEKRDMIARIMAAPILSPLLKSTIDKPIKSPWSVYSFHMAVMRNRTLSVVLAVLLIVAITSGGVARAAESALPGDTLYSFKVNLSEPLRAALAFTLAAKARIQARFADTRLEEAETLASQGKLDTKKEKQITDLLDEHATTLAATIDEVRKSSPELADGISLAFQASMDAHARVLDVIDSYQVASATETLVVAAPRASTSFALMATSAASSKKGEGSNVAEAARAQATDFGKHTSAGISASSKQAGNGTRSSDAFRAHTDSVRSLIDRASTTLDSVTDGTPIQKKIFNETFDSLNRARQAFQKAAEEERSGNQSDADSSLLQSEKSVREAGTFLNAGVRFGSQDSKEGYSGH